MATFKEIGGKDKYTDDDALSTVIRYITQDSHAISQYIGAVGVEIDQAAEQMIWTSKHFHKYSKKRLRHFVLSFEGYHSEESLVIYSVGERIAEKIGKRYQVVFAVHENTKNLHLHIIFNAVSFVDGKRYRGTKEEYHQLVKICGKAVQRAGLGYVKTAKTESGETS